MGLILVGSFTNGALFIFNHHLEFGLLRGRDKKKDAAPDYAAYYPFGVDVFLSQRKIDHIARLVELPVINSSGTFPPPILVVNVQVYILSVFDGSLFCVRKPACLFLFLLAIRGLEGEDVVKAPGTLDPCCGYNLPQFFSLCRQSGLRFQESDDLIICFQFWLKIVEKKLRILNFLKTISQLQSCRAIFKLFPSFC